MYRFGDDDDIDGLHETRWALVYDHADGSTEEDYRQTMELLIERVNNARDTLRYPNVKNRLTTHQRRTRGLSDTRRVT
ncbi:hypothetical protein [uncultured Microbacterium sp.]|uniref:hypothetical protein n=1 Tax=uncultured Microbacterium sp. TaxID=191216 RepID=UPI0025F727FF|nr:hypothetical protein [uncultured Microbacterium sp.]